MLEFGNFSMDYISIAFLLIIIIFCIIGIIKGFIQGVIRLVKSLASTIISALISKPVANILASSALGTGWASQMSGKLLAKGGIFEKPYGTAAFDDIFGVFPLPDSLRDFLQKLMDSLFNNGAGDTVAQVVANAAVYYGLLMLCFIVFYILLRLIFNAISKLFTALEDSVVIVKWANHLLGLVFFGIIGVLIVSGITYVMTFIVPLDNSVSAWILEELQLDSDKMSVSRFFYEHNILLRLITLIQGWLIK